MLSEKMTSDFAELCGIHAGDGWMSSYTNEVGYGTSPKEEQYFEYVLNLYKKLFNPSKIRILRRKAIEFRFQSKDLQNILMCVGFPRGKKLDKLKTPTFIFENEAFMKLFLRGLADTDGNAYWRLSVNRRHLVISWSTTAKLLASEVFSMLNSLGYHPHISALQPNINDGYVRRKMFRINLIRQQDIKKYIEDIGFKNNTRWNQVYKLPDELKRYGLAINEPARI